jgi:hypothetical protein
MHRDAAHGYVLEEVLAWLIRNAGYRLLVDSAQDARELTMRGAGLVVRGRGGVHQADVLGELAWIPAFTFPVRLFVEAKFRRKKVGIPEVRAAVGIVDDLNQNYAPMFSRQYPATQRYSYRYALFSTAGFTKTAVDMATAHQISLVDLRAPGFGDLLGVVRWSVDALFGGDPRRRAIRVRSGAIRTRLRGLLGTSFPEIPPTPPPEEVKTTTIGEVFEPDDAPPPSERGETGSYIPTDSDFAAFEDRLSDGVHAFHEFFLGVPNGPFLLLLRATDPLAFLAFVREHPSHDVHITWDWRDANGQEWRIEPVGAPNAYELRFALPEGLAEWIFERAEEATKQAARAKRRYLSRISIYRNEDGRDEIFSLNYQPSERRPSSRTYVG